MTTPSSIWQRRLNPLNREIRLLVLEPSGDVDSPPKGRMKVHLLGDPMPFDAISHAWGYPQSSKLIHFPELKTYWPITANLCSALQFLRDSVKPRAIWVDALCINPFDDAERSQQIALLRYIFRDAQAVRVWLGPVSQAMMRATSTVISLASQPTSSNWMRGTAEVTRLNIAPFFESEWWDRLWVKQEVALARRVVFHSRDLALSWDDLKRAQKSIILHLQSDEAMAKQLRRASGQESVSLEEEESNRWVQRFLDFEKLMELKDYDLNEKPRLKITKLVKILQSCRQARVTDPRDRVYSFLGICSQLFSEELDNKPLMEANYRESVVSVYTTFALRLIELSGSLYLFNQVSPLHNSLMQLPSWVPDWTSFFDNDSRMLSELHGRFYAADRNYSKLSVAKPSPNLAFDPIRLGLEGYIIGRVLVTDSVYHSYGNPLLSTSRKAMSDTVKRWQTNYLNHRSRFEDESAVDRRTGAFASLMTGSCRNVSSKEYDTRKDMEKTKSICETAARDEHVKQFHRVMVDSRFFLSVIEEKDVCPSLGPPDAMVGDEIAILNGGSTPYVLRRHSKDRNNNLFSFVGECFIYGIMRGEQVPQRGSTMIWLA